MGGEEAIHFGLPFGGLFRGIFFGGDRIVAVFVLKLGVELFKGNFDGSITIDHGDGMRFHFGDRAAFIEVTIRRLNLRVGIAQGVKIKSAASDRQKKDTSL